MLLLFFLLFLSTVTRHVVCDIPPPDCHNFNGFCYFFPYVKYNPIVNQATARQICIENGGDLPSIHSAAESEFFEEMVLQLPFKYWLGLIVQFENTNGDSPVAAVSWTDGTPVDFANPTAPGFVFGSEPWADYTDAEVSDEPNNFLHTTTPYCTDIKTHPAVPTGWETQGCGALLRVVCKKPI